MIKQATVTIVFILMIIGFGVIIVFGVGSVMNTSESELQKICTDFFKNSKLKNLGDRSYLCISADGKILNKRMHSGSTYKFYHALDRCYKKEKGFTDLAMWPDQYACIAKDGTLLWTMEK